MTGMEAQFTPIKARAGTLRDACEWRVRSALAPVPVSPVISTVESVGATFRILGQHGLERSGDDPTISYEP